MLPFLEFSFHLPIRKLSVFSLMLIMLLLAGCGSDNIALTDHPPSGCSDSDYLAGMCSTTQ